ncbi:MAG: MAPEG family protein [Siculibacillus sp.]|nr:MAPEG family protein [Siculibacillus sp.]
MSPLERLAILAVLLQIVTTIAVGFWLGKARKIAVQAGTITGDVMLSQEGWPKQARAASNSFSNQFEVPVLFYVLVLLALWLKAASPVFVACAWIFAVSRIAHAVAHCWKNRLRFRGPAYFVGVAAVIVMTGLIAAAVVGA